MQFSKVFYRYVVTSSAQATVVMGGDSAPTTVFGTAGTPPPSPYAGKASAANIDNILACRINGVSAPTPVQRIAVAMSGPTGAASPTANLYVWDGLTTKWYLVNAAPVTLVQNQIVFIDAVSLAESIPNQQSAQAVSQGGADYMLVVIPPGSPTTGQYSFAMAAILTTP